MANVSVDGGNDWGGLGREDGGNVAKGKGETHGGGSAKNIAQDETGRNSGGSTGDMKGSFGPTRQRGDGNMPVTGEKHGRPEGAEYIDHENGRGGAMRGGVPTNVQVDGGDRGPSGNSKMGKKEPCGSKKGSTVSIGLDRL